MSSLRRDTIAPAMVISLDSFRNDILAGLHTLPEKNNFVKEKRANSVDILVIWLYRGKLSVVVEAFSTPKRQISGSGR